MFSGLAVQELLNASQLGLTPDSPAVNRNALLGKPPHVKETAIVPVANTQRVGANFASAKVFPSRLGQLPEFENVA
jgi:hypothetical protein